MHVNGVPLLRKRICVLTISLIVNQLPKFTSGESDQYVGIAGKRPVFSKSADGEPRPRWGAVPGPGLLPPDPWLPGPCLVPRVGRWPAAREPRRVQARLAL